MALPNFVNKKPAIGRITDAEIRIRTGGADDLEDIIQLDTRNTGIAKPGYWRETFKRFEGRQDRHFVVAEGAEDGRFVGFIVGEVRAWEFGSAPCGWILTIGVEPVQRVRGIGTRLFDEICRRFRRSGITVVRTMLARDDRLNMAFFRSQGLMAGPFIELERRMDDPEAGE